VNYGGIDLTLLRTQSSRYANLGKDEISAALTAFDAGLQADRPDALLTYGGDVVSSAFIQLARRRDIPVVVALHNVAYRRQNLFQNIDCVVVPSNFARDYYWKHLGVHAHVLPNIVDPARVRAASPQPEYVTFVNPQPPKGVYVFARIVEQLARRRPDIPMLVVEGRGNAIRWLEWTGVDFSWVENLFSIPAAPDPREFYALSKIVLTPSLCEETFGLVAAEAMCNGVPVLSSDRGALPETVGDAGFLFSIPEKYTPVSMLVPTADEVEQWVEKIIQLWDDPPYYKHASDRAFERAKQWEPERTAPRIVQFFQNVRSQPNPPFVPLGSMPAA
jgi:glycosyltransferase involved in cell wall biosynthesis